ncbi:heat shock protein HSS1 [Lophium mytilinum]|uniref:Heat shock protein HSS1 n=1 Tax=Lophium mytilinum TaxID=390894 RepID=A0A6A6RBB9_9PEZI|nr:heat shock protein HSS1 [Lophium mytilinum]
MERAIGIDLGTAYTCAAIGRFDQVEIIPDLDDGCLTMPSCVAFTNKSRLVGSTAKNQAASNPSNTIFNAMRFIGRKFADPEVQYEVRHSSMRIVSINEKPAFKVEYQGKTKDVKPEEIIAMIIARVKENAEAYLGSKLKGAIFTVPAYFNQSQRQSIRDAAHIAGVGVYNFFSAPTAASLDYALNTLRTGKRNVLFVDVGAGTVNVKLSTIEEGIIAVQATAGDLHLGGEDFDIRIMEKMIQTFKRNTGHDLTISARGMLRLRKECEKAKCQLSYQKSTRLELDSLYSGIDFYWSITRKEFVEECTDLFRAILDPIEQVLKEGEIKDFRKSKESVNEVVLLGGSSRLPTIQELLAVYFEGKHISKILNPDESAARGAAIQASKFNPQDELPGGGLSRKLDECLVLNSIPFPIGFDTGNGVMEVAIKPHTMIPKKKSVLVSTWQDNQSELHLTALEGSVAQARHKNVTALGSYDSEALILGKTYEALILGKISIPVPLASRGVSHVEVTFDVDAQGRVGVTARDQSTGKSKYVSLDDYRRLSDYEIEKMEAEAAIYTANEHAEKKRIRAKNALEVEALEMRNHKLLSHPSAATAVEMRKTIDGVLEWLEKTEYADSSEYENKNSDLKRDFAGFIQQKSTRSTSCPQMIWPAQCHSISLEATPTFTSFKIISKSNHICKKL